MSKDPQLGLTLLQAREAKGVTMNEIAERCDLSRQAIYNVERGGERASVRMLRAYSLWFGLSLDRLLLSWGYPLEDIFGTLRDHPELVGPVRDLLRRELATQG